MFRRGPKVPVGAAAPVNGPWNVLGGISGRSTIARICVRLAGLASTDSIREMPRSGGPPQKSWVESDEYGALPDGLAHLEGHSPLLGVGLLQGVDIDFGHLEQGLHHFLGVPRFRVTHHLAQDGRDDLPGDSKLVFEPTAG